MYINRQAIFRQIEFSYDVEWFYSKRCFYCIVHSSKRQISPQNLISIFHIDQNEGFFLDLSFLKL